MELNSTMEDDIHTRMTQNYVPRLRGLGKLVWAEVVFFHCFMEKF